MEAVVEELAKLIAKGSGDRHIDSGELRESLWRREQMLSTAMGCGIAFPHCTSPQLTRPLFALGLSREGVDGDAPDNKAVNIFFVVISPEKDPDAHLEALASASKVFTNPAVRDSILAAETPQDVVEVIAAAERERE